MRLAKKHGGSGAWRARRGHRGKNAMALASANSGKHGSSPAASQAFSLRPGTPVTAGELSDAYQGALSGAGVNDQLDLLGTNGDHSYYRGVGSAGQTCFVIGNTLAPALVACLHSEEAMPTALFDANRVTMASDMAPQLVADEGIAADQVATVGIERRDGSLVTTPVTDNVYRFSDDAIPATPLRLLRSTRQVRFWRERPLKSVERTHVARPRQRRTAFP